MGIDKGGPLEAEVTNTNPDDATTVDNNLIPIKEKGINEVIIEEGSSPVDWDKYVGSEISVVDKKTGETVPQNVTSLDRMEDRKIAEAISGFLKDASEELGMGYFIGESGRWIVLGRGIHNSEIFHDNGIDSIGSRVAFDSLITAVDKTLQAESEEDLNGLILVHTHPGPDVSPLSSPDIRSLDKIKDFLGAENRFEVIAIPIPRKGEIIFSHRIS